MKRQTLISFSIVLTLLGFADAWYLADAALTGSALTCDIAGLTGCNTVAQSPYSHVLGVPLGVYGVAFYTLMLLIALWLHMHPKRAAARLFAVLATLGFVASLGFVYIQVALIKALCVYCLGSALIAALLVVPAWLLLKEPRSEALSAPPSA